MTFFFTPRFPIVAQSWIKTLTSMSSIFNKKKFVIEDTFQFEDFEPAFDFGTMAGSGLIINQARALKIKNLAFIEINYNVDLAIGTGWSATISFTIPYTARLPIEPSSAGNAQAGGIRNASGGTGEVGSWRIVAGTNIINVYRYNDSNYAAGVHAARGNFFVEVEE